MQCRKDLWAVAGPDHSFCFWFETVSHFVAQASLKLQVHLLPTSWNHFHFWLVRVCTKTEVWFICLLQGMGAVIVLYLCQRLLLTLAVLAAPIVWKQHLTVVLISSFMTNKISHWGFNLEGVVLEILGESKFIRLTTLTWKHLSLYLKGKSYQDRLGAGGIEL